MIFFGHLGIGNTLAAPFRKGLPRRWILLGTIFPDLLDKSVYYGLSYATGKNSEEVGAITWGLINGTRTFGHTALFLIALWLVAALGRSRILAALALGIATHLILDGLTDYYLLVAHGQLRPTALLWPMSGWGFPILPHHSIFEHIGTWKNPFLIGSELGGALLLAWDFWKTKHRAEIVSFFQNRRIMLKKFKRHRS